MPEAGGKEKAGRGGPMGFRSVGEGEGRGGGQEQIMKKN
jgi:hypothetical protein